MGAHSSKRRWRNLASLERNSSQKKYLPATNGALCGNHEGTPSIEDKAAQELPPFTERQRELVVDTWKVVQEDIARVGITMFVKLFETHPEVQNVFAPFKDESQEDLQTSVQLKSHALRVLGTVDKCLANIHDPHHLQTLLTDLGARHIMYNAKVDYMDLIGPQFIWAIEPVLAQQWTPEVEQAWSDLFKFISHIMKTAMTF